MVKPAARRRVVCDWTERGLLSKHTGCRLLDISRSVVRYQAKPRDDDALRQRLRVLAEKYPRYGCPLLHGMLSLEGLVINRQRTYRLYNEEGLQVRTKKRKKLVRPSVPMALPTRANERWFLDFVSDQLADTSISGVRLARFLSELSRP